MAITTVLFDLDGTLLPMDQDVFVGQYFRLLAAKLAPRGYDPERLVEGIWSGTKAMIKNTGGRTNEEAFWEDFAERFGPQVRQDLPLFDEFYRTDFEKVRDVCGFTPRAAETVAYIKAKGLRLALATNPIFPAVATQSRIRWAGLDAADFEVYTTYENSDYCKPNLDYYRQVTDKLGVRPEECLMVGNDVDDDMPARALGMEVFLLTPCLINRKQADISVYPHGDFDDLIAFVDRITG